MSGVEPVWVTGCQSEEAAAEAIHDVAMSKDRAIACSGRLMKETALGLGRWLEAELKRGTPTDQILAAASDSAVGFLATAATNIVLHRSSAPPERRHDMVKVALLTVIANEFAKAVGETIACIDKLDLT